MSNFVTNTSHKSRRTALILCLFLGMIGVHYFYVGRIGRGMLALITMNFFVFGWFADIFSILLGKFKDQYGNALIEW